MHIFSADSIHALFVRIISVVIVLGILVLVHEFGHFLAAKLCGVRVEQFSIGFPPRLFGIKIGDTDYCISATPLGGYVKMTGESMPGENMSLKGPDGETLAANAIDPGALTSHPRWQRIIIGLAGPFANFVLALVVMTGYYMLLNEVPLYEEKPVTLDWVTPGSAADKAGLQAGDVIVSFDSKANPTWETVGQSCELNLQSKNVNHSIPLIAERAGNRIATSLSLDSQVSNGSAADQAKAAEQFSLEKLGLLPVLQPGPIHAVSVAANSPASRAGIEAGDEFVSIDGHQFHGTAIIIDYLQSTKGAPLTVVVNRNGQTSTKIVQPFYDTANPPSAWRIGFQGSQPPFRVVQLGFVPAMKASAKFSRDNSMLILEVLKRLLTNRMSVSSLSGSIGISQQTELAAESPTWEAKFKLLSAISLNLGILNLLPFPILDGGMILFLLIESVMRRDVNMVFKERVYQAAFVVIILFIGFIMFNDLSKTALFTHGKP